MQQSATSDYEQIVNNMAEQVFDALKPRTSPEDMERVRRAFLFAKEAHAPQRRKSGEPYILHPVAVALITAKELQMDANTVITAFLHDVVEDTPYTVEDIRERFGSDVAGLVNVVTKKKKDAYKTTKQVDNYQQILASMHYDIRAVIEDQRPSAQYAHTAVHASRQANEDCRRDRLLLCPAGQQAGIV